MTPACFLDALRSLGLTVRILPDGRLGVSPAELLDDEARELIREHRDDLLSLLTSEEEQTKWDEWADAIAERAWHDPPEFGAGHTCLRESVLLRLEGFPVVAVSPEEAQLIQVRPKPKTPRPKKKPAKELFA